MNSGIETRVASYPLLPYFEGRTFSDVRLSGDHPEWSIEYSRRFFEWYRAQASGSYDRLSKLVGFRLEPTLDDTRVVQALDTLLQALVLEPAFGKREISSNAITVGSEHIPLKHRDFVRLSEAGWSILFDCAVAFAAAVMHEDPKLQYTIVRKRGKYKDLDESLPVVSGFPTGSHFYPPNIMHNILASYLHGPGRLIEVYRIWKDRAVDRAM